VAYRLYGVIGNSVVLGGLRHPSMHVMEPLAYGLGVCHVRIQVAMDEPLAPLPGTLPRLTESVLGYLEVVSEQAPVVYVAADGDSEAAGGWHAGAFELGPLRSGRGTAPRLLRRRETGAVNEALRWIHAPRSGGRDRAATLGLADRDDWNPLAT
jgi:hypothetical protein